MVETEWSNDLSSEPYRNYRTANSAILSDPRPAYSVSGTVSYMQAHPGSYTPSLTAFRAQLRSGTTSRY
ncbi:hypothetical protein RRG08_042551 [Elysia crispata]|uniref:Uncharacterized protein n=1 Tax=Elysia crispata TaxID=231223 RepID=A0AAE0XQM6_9GAST|nr:hypothetical protein RRG08_042551 [Elysia crispata]